MDRSKGIRSWFFAILLAVMVTSPLVVNAQGKPVVLTVASAYSLANKEHVAGMYEWIKKIETVSNGRIKIDVKGGPEVTPAKDLLKACQSGMYDLIYTATPYHAGELPILQIATFIDPAKQKQLIADPKIYNSMNSLLEKYKLRYMSENQPGLTFYIWMNRKPPMENGKVVSLKGLQIRSIGNLNAKQIEAVGGTPVVLAPGEMYDALKMKTVDGTVAHPGSISELHLTDVVNYLVKPGFLSISGLYLMNKASYDRLSPDLQKMIDDTNVSVALDMYEDRIAHLSKLVDGFVQEKKIEILESSPGLVKTLAETRKTLLKIMSESEKTRASEIVQAFEKYYD